MNFRFCSAALLCLFGISAQAVSPEPAPLAQKEQLTIGYIKVGHLAPMLMVEDTLKRMNVEVKRAEFVRYADARTALLSGSVDVSAVGPGDLAIAASQGSRNLVGLTGVAGSPKYLVVRNGVPVFDGKMSTLRRFQDEVDEVKVGQECGIRLGEFNEYLEGDLIECYTLEKVPQEL